ncbi:15428_t:CDS:2, partial [Gigaspora rosea]
TLKGATRFIESGCKLLTDKTTGAKPDSITGTNTDARHKVPGTIIDTADTSRESMDFLSNSMYGPRNELFPSVKNVPLQANGSVDILEVKSTVSLSIEKQLS